MSPRPKPTSTAEPLQQLPPEFAHHPPLRPLTPRLLRLLPVGAVVTDRHGLHWTVSEIDPGPLPILRHGRSSRTAPRLRAEHGPLLLPDPAQLKLWR